MKAWMLTLLGTSALMAADQEQLARAWKAQADFDRVTLSAVPPLHDTTVCVQTQASLIPVATRDELPLVHYRKGYCTLASATITHDSVGFTDAAAEFNKAIESWQARATAEKNKPPEPVSPGLRVLASVARLKAGPDGDGVKRAEQEISAALQGPPCAPGVMTLSSCQAALQTGKQWVGWMALERGDLDNAAGDFAGSGAPGWTEWVAGRKAFRAGKYKESASQYRLAVDAWKHVQQEPSPSVMASLGPKPDIGEALTDFGGALLLAGEPAAATATLDEAIQWAPANSRAFYLRARAKGLAGYTEASLADYNMAARAAFAAAQDLASGEAHLYRGILLYRRRDYPRAEAEFSSALNFEVPASLLADTVAWRHLAAVAGGACSVSRELLEQSLSAVSPFFPRDEAGALVRACFSQAASGAGLHSPK
jgi:tetratricopeptide (TPR) repeat protein